ncbi:MAG TPA: hypothetical protein VKB80_01010 [Kofleriaceae bacterium]|nr:hypothetical protein [Kofleriaceae bacterium]
MGSDGRADADAHAELDALALFDGSMPESWSPLVAAVSELGALAALQAKAGEEGMAARRAQAAALRARILAAAGQHVEASPEQLAWGSPRSRRWFCEAVLLWTHFAGASGRVRIDMLGSPELVGFPVDLPDDAAARARVRAGLVAGLGVGDDELADIERGLEHRLSNLAVKRAITDEIARRLEAGGAEAAVRLMCAVYGELPLRAGDVAPVVTASGVFFCLPFTDGRLDLAGFGGRPAEERAAIADFATRMEKAATSLKNVRFPAFGLFDPAAVAPGFYRELADAISARDPALARAGERVIAETFPTMVLVIPSGDAAKYLIHDSWGHAWQESLCEFEWLFGDFQGMSAPLRAEAVRSGFRVAGGGGGAGGSSERGERVELDRAALERAVGVDLRRRTTIGLNLMIAESLADLMEHKYGRQREPLPSSSLLPEGILKLDLSWIDATRVARLWSAPYRRLAGSVEARRALADELAGLGLPRDGLAEAVDDAVNAVGERFAAALSSPAHGTVAAPDGRVAVDLVQRAVLGVATLEAALDSLLRRGEERLAARAGARPDEPRWRCPAACIDLIALLVGWYYDQDPALHIWHLDEVVLRELWPGLLALEAGIDAGGS